jgi:hypothetical protein
MAEQQQHHLPHAALNKTHLADEKAIDAATDEQPGNVKVFLLQSFSLVRKGSWCLGLVSCQGFDRMRGPARQVGTFNKNVIRSCHADNAFDVI